MASIVTAGLHGEGADHLRAVRAGSSHRLGAAECAGGRLVDVRSAIGPWTAAWRVAGRVGAIPQAGAPCRQAGAH